MANYETSTQAKHWTFHSVEELEQVRTHARASYEERRKSGRKPCYSFASLSRDEELGFQASYLTTMKKLCARQDLNSNLSQRKYSSRLYWTAATLFKRFFLRHSMMAENPKLMLMVSIYVAGKVEEIPLTAAYRGINVETLAKLGRLNQHFIVDSEIRFLGGIDFEMVTYHPVRPFFGLLQSLREEQPQHENLWMQLEGTGSDLLEEYLITDACFLYSPSKIAFASVLAWHAKLDPPAPFSSAQLVEWMTPSSEVPPGFGDKMTQLATTLEQDKERFTSYISLVSKDKRTKDLNQWAEWWNTEYDKPTAEKRKRPAA